ncbi:hypothetical protein [Candidatus Desulfovibrio trichonymphae]|nr:hypothetical protein [Candidatus Desulfovibrio trichonymphae]
MKARTYESLEEAVAQAPDLISADDGGHGSNLVDMNCFKGGML